MESRVIEFLGWLSANQAILIPVVVLIGQQILSVLNGNLKYQTEAGILRSLLDRISTSTNADSPGTHKLPFVASQPPPVVGSPVAVVK